MTSASKSSIRRFVITEKAPTRDFSWLKAATTAFTFKTLCMLTKLPVPYDLCVSRSLLRDYEPSDGTFFSTIVPAVYWSSLLTVFYSLRCASPLFMFRTSPLSTNNIHTEIISIAVNRITSKLQPPSLPCKHNLQCLNLNKGSK